jgi:hypothetical protein
VKEPNPISWHEFITPSESNPEFLPLPPGKVFSMREYADLRTENAPYYRKQLVCSKQAEVRILILLRRPGLSEEDRKNLESALANIRRSFAMAWAMCWYWDIIPIPESNQN